MCIIKYSPIEHLAHKLVGENGKIRIRGTLDIFVGMIELNEEKDGTVLQRTLLFRVPSCIRVGLPSFPFTLSY